MSFPATDEPESPRPTPAVLWLLALNVAVYFVQVTVQGDLPVWLGFRGRFPEAWWTPLTYMFVHGGFWHLALNMYTLWVFGPRIEREWSAASFVGFYLWCGLGGVAAHALLIRGPSLLVGASAAIFGVIFAYARRWPDEEVLFFGVVPMKVRWLVAFMAITNLALGFLSAAPDGLGGGDRTAYFAHLGGFVFAWLYFLRPSTPNVERLRQRVASAPDLGDEPPRPVPRSLPRPRERGSDADEVVEKSKAVTARPTRHTPAPPRRPAPPVPAAAGTRTEALDHVLDKISQHGMASLTPDERTLLEEMSRKLRDS
jgi:membrane associated rhomboid family serine protease